MVNTKQILSLGWQLIGMTPPGKADVPLVTLPAVAPKAEQGAARQVTVTVALPGLIYQPETVTLSAPVVALETLAQIADVAGFLAQLYPGSSEELRARSAAFALCHHGCTYRDDQTHYNVMYSPAMLYLNYAMWHPEVFERISQAYNTAFDAEIKQIVALVHAEIAENTGKHFPTRGNASLTPAKVFPI